MSNTEIKNFWDEEWKELVIEDSAKQSKYMLSNYGRVISYFYNKKGVLLKVSGPNGYKCFTVKGKDGLLIRHYIHRLVAKYFLDKPRDDQNIVVHIDNSRGNNYYKNLRWANVKEKQALQDINTPRSTYVKKGFRAYSKLTETQVKLIKRKINDPNRKTRMKIIAKRYGISEMQLYRIKSGENWSSVNPD